METFFYFIFLTVLINKEKGFDVDIIQNFKNVCQIVTLTSDSLIPQLLIDTSTSNNQQQQTFTQALASNIHDTRIGVNSYFFNVHVSGAENKQQKAELFVFCNHISHIAPNNFLAAVSQKYCLFCYCCYFCCCWYSRRTIYLMCFSYLTTNINLKFYVRGW